ncbi:PAS domain S-box protein [candidate division WOR-3 bacterium]|nr:PAS domain S-box protein [candidate division WOR-3 bacterium]
MEKCFEVLFNSLKNPVVFFDGDCKVKAFNVSFREFTNRAESEIQNHDLKDLIPGFCQKEILNQCSKSIENKREYRGEIVFNDRNVLFSVQKARKLYFLVIEDWTEKKRAERELQRERDAYHYLVESSTKASDIKELCEDFLKHFIDIFDLDKGSVRLLDKSGKKLDLFAAIGFSEEEKKDQEKPRFLREKKHITTYVAATKKPIFAPDTENHFLKEIFSRRIKKIKSLFSWPLIDDLGEVYGVFHLIGNHKKGFSEKDRIFFENTAIIFSEILKRKFSQEKLAESEKNLRSIQENIPIGIFRTDVNGKIISANPAFVNIFGYKSIEEIKMVSVVDLYVKERDRLKLLRLHEKQEEVRSYEIEMKKKNGDKIVCLCNEKHELSKTGEVAFIDGSIEDITLRKKAQKDLEETKERYRLLYESADDAIFLMKDYLFIDCNHKASEMFCLEKNLLLGKKPFETSPEFQPDGISSAVKAIDRMNNAMSGKSQRFDWVHKRGDGSLFNAEVSLNRFTAGGKVYLQAIVRDFTEKTKYINALKDAEARFRSFMELAPDILFRVQIKENKCELLSPSVEKILGYKVEEIENNPINFFSSIIHQEDKEKINEIFSQKQTHSEKEDSVEFRFRAEKKDGDTIWMRATVRMEFENGEVIRANSVISDITNQIKMEEELGKIEKLKSVGVLAGGIAHDFNNILMGILGNISLSKEFLNGKSEVYKLLEEAEKASIRAKNLTKQLLTFSKGGQPVKKAMRINELLSEACVFSTRGSKCKIDFDFQKELFFVEVDEDQIAQVFNNIIINAVQSMPRGGIIKIKAHNTHVGTLSSPPLKSGDYVLVSITDQGYGIDEEKLAKKFDPFFTTKDSGSGLGLTTAYSIVKNHGGTILVESEKYRGSTFQIYLPSTSKPVEKIDKNPKVEKGKGRVLIMDDERSVVGVLSQMLSYLGYESESASNGEDALLKFEASVREKKPYSAVIMDLTIQGGGMGGKETVPKILEIDPFAVVFVSSGYSDDPVITNYKTHGFSGYLTKPYDISELSELLAKYSGGK